MIERVIRSRSDGKVASWTRRVFEKSAFHSRAGTWRRAAFQAAAATTCRGAVNSSALVGVAIAAAKMAARRVHRDQVSSLPLAGYFANEREAGKLPALLFLKRLLPPRQLLFHFLGPWRAWKIPPGKRPVQVKYLQHLGIQFGIGRLQLRHVELMERFA